MRFSRIPILSFLVVILSSSCSGPNDLETVVITGSSTVAPVVADAALRYEAAHPGVRIEVQTGGSSRGIADVRSGLAQLGMASRALKENESDLVEHTIAMDGVALIVHRDNPLTSLTKQQSIDLFTKKKTTWMDAGDSADSVVVVSKAEGRATLEVFLEYLGLDSAEMKADVLVGENQHAIKTVAGNPLAIGYVSIGAASAEIAAGVPIRVVNSDEVAPTAETVASGEFPIVRPLNIVTRGEPIGPAADFLRYLQSPDIRDIVETHLYVPKN